ncbi:MAG: hypothetical protein J7J91_09625 [Deltaproteobacteria bacterium]|nr:hypothetical protein [Deltaproteobacteria bacterium]
MRRGFWFAFALLTLYAGYRLLLLSLRDFAPERDLPGLLVITTFFIFVPACYIILELKRPVLALLRILKGYLKPKPPETPILYIEPEPEKPKRRRKLTPKHFEILDKPIEYKPRTGEILKELGIKREKIRKVTKVEREKIDTCLKKPEDRTKEMLLIKWRPLINELMEKGFVYFPRDYHFGQIRGRDAARAFYRDLKRLGYRGKVRLILDDYDARVEWVEN